MTALSHVLAHGRFTMVYSVVHIFHLMNKSAQEELREGVADIEAEEAKQGQFSQCLTLQC